MRNESCRKNQTDSLENKNQKPNKLSPKSTIFKMVTFGFSIFEIRCLSFVSKHFFMRNTEVMVLVAVRLKTNMPSTVARTTCRGLITTGQVVVKANWTSSAIASNSSLDAAWCNTGSFGTVLALSFAFSVCKRALVGLVTWLWCILCAVRCIAGCMADWQRQ